MLGRAGAVARRTVTSCMGQLPAAGLHPQLACVQTARLDCLSDYGAAPCSMRMASGGNSALTTLPGRSSLTATARSLLVDTLDMVGAWFSCLHSRPPEEATRRAPVVVYICQKHDMMPFQHARNCRCCRCVISRRWDSHGSRQRR